MKFRDPETGEFKELYTKAADTLPVGAEVDFDGDEVPAGWEPVSGVDVLFEGDITETGVYTINGRYGDYRLLILEGSTGTISAAARVVVPGYKIISDWNNYVQFGIEDYNAGEYYTRYSGHPNERKISINAIKNVHIRRISGIK